MRYLTLAEVLDLQRRVLDASGGSAGVRDLGALESAVAQPLASFGAQDLYPSLVEKAAALAFSLVKNHAFGDGNKRLAHAAMEVFLVLNGAELACGVDEQEQFWLALAAGQKSRALTSWPGSRLTLEMQHPGANEGAAERGDATDGGCAACALRATRVN
jgi:death-on-curing protein